MGRALVRQKDAAVFGRFTFGLPLDQAGDSGRHDRQVLLLPGDDVRQVLDGAGQVGDLFLKAGYVIHDHQIAPVAREIKPRSSPVVALARAPR